MNEKLQEILNTKKHATLSFSNAVRTFFENEIKEYREKTRRSSIKFTALIKKYLVDEGFLIRNDSGEYHFADSKYGCGLSQGKVRFNNRELAKEFFEKAGLLELE